MSFLSFIFRGRHERTGFVLYGEAVRAAREPAYFTDLAVPDTLDGRFDLVGLFTALLIRRLTTLPAPGPAVAQSVFDAMFADMDINLREMGVGDMTIAKRVRAMWEAFHGRALAYAPALAQGDQATLSAALARNVWRGQAPEGAAVRLARAALAQDRHLSSLGLAELRAGGTIFLPSAQVLS